MIFFDDKFCLQGGGFQGQTELLHRADDDDEYIKFVVSSMKGFMGCVPVSERLP